LHRGNTNRILYYFICDYFLANQKEQKELVIKMFEAVFKNPVMQRSVIENSYDNSVGGGSSSGNKTEREEIV